MMICNKLLHLTPLCSLCFCHHLQPPHPLPHLYSFFFSIIVALLYLLLLLYFSPNYYILSHVIIFFFIFLCIMHYFFLTIISSLLHDNSFLSCANILQCSSRRGRKLSRMGVLGQFVNDQSC